MITSEVASGMTIRVPQGYWKIQDAIDWSANGDEIVVAPGEYTLIAFVDRLDQVIETDETSSYVLIRHVVVPSP